MSCTSRHTRIPPDRLCYRQPQTNNHRRKSRFSAHDTNRSTADDSSGACRRSIHGRPVQTPACSGQIVRRPSMWCFDQSPEPTGARQAPTSATTTAHAAAGAATPVLHDTNSPNLPSRGPRTTPTKTPCRGSASTGRTVRAQSVGCSRAQPNRRKTEHPRHQPLGFRRLHVPTLRFHRQLATRLGSAGSITTASMGETPGACRHSSFC